MPKLEALEDTVWRLDALARRLVQPRDTVYSQLANNQTGGRKMERTGYVTRSDDRQGCASCGRPWVSYGPYNGGPSCVCYLLPPCDPLPDGIAQCAYCGERFDPTVTAYVRDADASVYCQACVEAGNAS